MCGDIDCAVHDASRGPSIGGFGNFPLRADTGDDGEYAGRVADAHDVVIKSTGDLMHDSSGQVGGDGSANGAGGGKGLV